MRRYVRFAAAILVAGCVSEPAPETVPLAPQADPRGPVEVEETTTTSSIRPVKPSDEGSFSRITCWASDTSGRPGVTAWRDVTEVAGLLAPLAGMQGHTAAFGDINGDGRPDLVVGTFADRPDNAYAYRGASGPAPDRVLLGGAAFVAIETLGDAFGRTSGAAFVDLDRDGDLDLVLSRNVRDRTRGALPTTVYENRGGLLLDVAELGDGLGGRSIGILDADGDGNPDIFVAEDRRSGGSSRLFRNEGDLVFRDASAELGLPPDVHGLGVAIGDLDGDRRSDLVVGGSNRVFLGTGTGLAEAEVPGLQWQVFGTEDDVSGAALADVNRDGRLDLVLGHDYSSTIDVGATAPVRLYLNATESPGEVAFEDVTEEAGLIGLPTKAPHVQIADVDNDGWPDIVTSASAGSGALPAIFRHTGLVGGIPRFELPDGLGSEQYWVTSPVQDVNRDGRLDVLLVERNPAHASILLSNESRTGHWLEVSVGESFGGGIGTKVQVFDPSDWAEPLGTVELSPTVGYAAGVAIAAHFGLGDLSEVDLLLTPPPPHQPFVLEGIPVDRHIRLPWGCDR